MATVALLGLGRLLVGLAPVTVEIEADGQVVRVTADGTSRRLVLPRPLVLMRLVAPLAYRREHQIDGSDSTNMLTFDWRYFAAFGSTPYYQFQALLREEWRYSRWTNLTVMDATAQAVLREPRPPDDVDIALPSGPFRLTVDLERPEIPRALDLVDDERRVLRLELNRNDKYIRLGYSAVRDETDLTAWYFPRGWAPPLATLLDLVVRAGALALGLVLVAWVLAALLPAPVTWQAGPRALAVGVPIGLTFLLVASLYATIVLFDRAPHILDAVSYVFQAKVLASGALTAPPPLVADAFPIPFGTLYQERLFSQYPPGTAAVLALGYLVSLPWLVEPLMAVGAVVLIVLAARRQYGPGTALLALLLLMTSPFLLLNAASFLSHVPALFFASIALYAAVRYAERPSVHWAAMIAAGLGLALLTRELVPMLYGVTVVLAGLVRGAPLRGRGLVLDLLAIALLCGAALGLFLAYNAALTGDPLMLPRLAVNGRDLYGFGTDIGFYSEHTVASGLVITEQNLVSLGFYLGGWPFGFSLALLLLPFLLRRTRPWDGSYGVLVVLYAVAYAAYFYHGIAFGPRYYFEALPAFVILTARGFAVLAAFVGDRLTALNVAGARGRARQATALIAVALLACNALYFLPRQTTLYAGFTGLPGGGPTLDATIGHDLAGRTARLDQALVVTREWWWYVLHYAALNCPRFDCPTVFALGADPETREILRRMYPDRAWYDAEDRRGVLTIAPGAP